MFIRGSKVRCVHIHCILLCVLIMVLSYTWFSHSHIGYLQSRTAFAQTLYAFSGIDYELPTNRNLDGHFYSSAWILRYPSFAFISLLSMMQIHDHSRYAQKCSNVQALGCKDQGILHWFSLTLLSYVAGDIHIDTEFERSIFPHWILITWRFLKPSGKRICWIWSWSGLSNAG